MNEEERILIIANPKSGRGAAKNVIPKLKDFFWKNRVKADFYSTKKPKDAIKKARDAAKSGKYEIIIACGGDGTVNEVLNGMMAAGKNGRYSNFGVIPLGTENVLAQETGVPFNPIKAAGIILKGKTKKIDLGMANRRYFVLMTGIGYDAHVVSKIKPAIKNIMGRSVYPLAAVKQLFNYRNFDLDVIIDRKIRTNGSFVVVGNIKLYGANLKITPKARIDDGFLDVCIFKGKDVFSFVKFALGAFAERHIDTSGIEYYKAKEVQIKSKEKVLYHVDCEIDGTTPVRIKACPSVIRMIVP